MALTRRQKQVLDFLARFINRHGYSPSFEEIGESLGMSSIATVHKHVENLERKGFIRRGYNQSRSIDVIAMPGPVPLEKIAWRAKSRSGPKPPATQPAGIRPSLEFPLLGRIAAGRPVETFPAAETFSLDEFAASDGKIFVLKVKGDSMVDDHICDGDYILVQRAEDVANSEIVVALVGGSEATLKRFFREPGGNVRLQPANSQMDPIFLPSSEVQVQGKVIGVMRKY
ncbi:MAG: transcriptional repressor LexA [Terriglobia bacterium]